MASSGNTERAAWSSSLADARSRPKGFFHDQARVLREAGWPRLAITVSNSVGGTAR